VKFSSLPFLEVPHPRTSVRHTFMELPNSPFCAFLYTPPDYPERFPHKTPISFSRKTPAFSPDRPDWFFLLLIVDNLPPPQTLIQDSLLTPLELGLPFSCSRQTRCDLPCVTLHPFFSECVIPGRRYMRSVICLPSNYPCVRAA